MSFRLQHPPQLIIEDHPFHTVSPVSHIHPSGSPRVGFNVMTDIGFDCKSLKNDCTQLRCVVKTKTHLYNTHDCGHCGCTLVIGTITWCSVIFQIYADNDSNVDVPSQRALIFTNGKPPALTQPSSSQLSLSVRRQHPNAPFQPFKSPFQQLLSSNAQKNKPTEHMKLLTVAVSTGRMCSKLFDHAPSFLLHLVRFVLWPFPKLNRILKNAPFQKTHQRDL